MKCGVFLKEEMIELQAKEEGKPAQFQGEWYEWQKKMSLAAAFWTD